MPASPVRASESPGPVSAVLNSPAPFVMLVGPRGTGKSAALHAHAREQGEAGVRVSWYAPGREPEPTAELLLLDDLQADPAGVWEELRQLRRRRPELRVRATTTTGTLVPPGHDVVLHEMPLLNVDAVRDLLVDLGSAAPAGLVLALTEGHPGSVRRIAESGARTLEESQAALAVPGAGPRLDVAEEALAVPTYLSPSLVAELGGPDDFFVRMERAGHGWWTGGPGRKLFVLVPTVRQTTVAHLSPPTSHDAPQVRERAAIVHLADGAAYASFVDALAAERLDLADRAIKLGGLPMLVEHDDLILSLLHPLSVRALSAHPVLAFALALQLNARRQNRRRALEVLAMAVVSARVARSRSPADRSLMRMVESVALRISGAGDSGLAAARHAARLWEEMSPEERLELGSLAPDIQAHGASTFLYAGQHDEAFEQFELAAGANPRRGVEVLALGGLATIEALRGDMGQTRGWVATALGRRWPDELVHGYPGSLLQVAEAHLALERLDLPAAHAALDNVWSMIETIEHWPLLGHVRALVALAEGRAAAGLEEFRSLRRRRTGHLGTTDWVRQRLDVTESLLLLGVGDPVAAKKALGGAQSTELLLARARVALVVDDREAAPSLLGRSRPTHPVDRMTAAALRAVLLRRRGLEAERQQALEQVDAVRHGYGLCSPLFLLPHGELAHLGELGAGLPEALSPGTVAPRLTQRELVVLRALIDTADVREIADQLHVSSNTVKSQRRSLYRKLGVSSRDEAVTAGLVYGFLAE